MTPTKMYNAYEVRHRKRHICMQFFINYRLLFIDARAQFETRRETERKYLFILLEYNTL